MEVETTDSRIEFCADTVAELVKRVWLKHGLWYTVVCGHCFGEDECDARQL